MRRFAIALIPVLALSVTAAGVQQDTQANRPVEGLTFEFKGGSIAEYLKTIQAQSQDANIIIRPEAADLPLGPVSLSRVALEGALDLLDGEYILPDGLYQLQVRKIAGGRHGENPIYTIDAKSKQTFGGRIMAEVQVFAIDDLLSGEVDEDDLLTVVETAIGMLETTDLDSEYQLRFHEATGVLIARAAPRQLSAIKQILSQLRESAGRRAATKADTIEQHRFEMMFHDERERSTMLQQRLDELERLAVTKETQAQLLEVELARLQARTDDLVNELRMHEQRTMQLEMMLSEAQTKLKAAQQKNDGGD